MLLLQILIIKLYAEYWCTAAVQLCPTSWSGFPRKPCHFLLDLRSKSKSYQTCDWTCLKYMSFHLGSGQPTFGSQWQLNIQLQLGWRMRIWHVCSSQTGKNLLPIPGIKDHLLCFDWPARTRGANFLCVHWPWAQFASFAIQTSL